MLNSKPITKAHSVKFIKTVAVTIVLLTLLTACIGEVETDLLILDDIGFFTDSDWADDVYIELKITNNSDGVVKDINVAWMGFDRDGYPIKTGYWQDEFLAEGVGEAINLHPGKQMSGYGWQISSGSNSNRDKAKSFIAIIKSATFYEGGDWENPDYDRWEKKHLNKQLPADYNGIVGVNPY